MAQRRTEIIVRLPNLSTEQAAKVEAALAPIVRRLAGSMSAIERDHQADGSALHVGRRKIV